MRIASLIASATEIVAALGLTDSLVGVSHECDYPLEAVRGRAVLTAPKMDVSGKSLDIHRDVEAIVARGLSVYNINVQKLEQTKPDVIITQDQCEVCAVTYDDVVRATETCLGGKAEIVTLHPDSLEDIFSDILKVGRALGVSEKAVALADSMRQKMSAVEKEAGKIAAKPRVVCLEWLNPLMVAGNWIPKMVAMAGGTNGLTKEGDHTKVISREELQTFDPDILLVMPCGFKIEQTLVEEEALKELPGNVFIIDGNAYMNRPGPRIVESLYILAGLLHPETFGPLIPENAVKNYVTGQRDVSPL